MNPMSPGMNIMGGMNRTTELPHIATASKKSHALLTDTLVRLGWRPYCAATATEMGPERVKVP